MNDWAAVFNFRISNVKQDVPTVKQESSYNYQGQQ